MRKCHRAQGTALGCGCVDAGRGVRRRVRRRRGEGRSRLAGVRATGDQGEGQWSEARDNPRTLRPLRTLRLETDSSPDARTVAVAAGDTQSKRPVAAHTARERRPPRVLASSPRPNRMPSRGPEPLSIDKAGETVTQWPRISDQHDKPGGHPTVFVLTRHASPKLPPVPLRADAPTGPHHRDAVLTKAEPRRQPEPRRLTRVSPARLRQHRCTPHELPTPLTSRWATEPHAPTRICRLH